MKFVLFSLFLAQCASLALGSGCVGDECMEMYGPGVGIEARDLEESTVYVTVCPTDFPQSILPSKPAVSTFSTLPRPAPEITTAKPALPLSTTSTVTTTQVITISTCPPAITNCPYKRKPLVTSTVLTYTTVCPVVPESTTSTITTTQIVTISTCAPAVTDCPYTTKPLVTSTVVTYTTVCPVTSTSTTTGPVVPTSAVTNPVKSTTSPVTSTAATSTSASSLTTASSTTSVSLTTALYLNTTSTIKPTTTLSGTVSSSIINSSSFTYSNTTSTVQSSISSSETISSLATTTSSELTLSSSLTTTSSSSTVTPTSSVSSSSSLLTSTSSAISSESSQSSETSSTVSQTTSSTISADISSTTSQISETSTITTSTISSTVDISSTSSSITSSTTDSSTTSSSTSSLPTASSFAVRGIVQVSNSASGALLGYISKNSFSHAQYRYQPATTDALIVDVELPIGATSGTRLRVTSENDDTGYSILGFVQGRDDADSTMQAGSFQYGYIAGVTGVPAGSTPQTVPNSYTTATGTSRTAESDIWSIDIISGAMTAEWINPNGVPASTLDIFSQGTALYFGGDAAAFATRYPSAVTGNTYTFIVTA